MIVQLDKGRQIVVSGDLDKPYIRIRAYGGSLGVEMTKEQAIAVSKAIWYAAKR
jgi:hypothetical protein